MDKRETDKKKPARDKADTDFLIRDFMDLRKLTKRPSKPDAKPADGAPDTALHHDAEEDFGLRRSTPEEAEQFLRDILEGDVDVDELTEFLDDD